MPTERKVQQVADLVDRINRAEVAIAASFSSESVSNQTALRQVMSNSSIEVKVIKNTLLKRAAAEAGKPIYGELADGPTAIAFAYDEPITAMKVLVTYLETLQDTNFVIRNGIYGNQVVDASYIQTLASLPSKEELLALIARNLIGKISEFASLLTATQRDFMGLLEARASQLELTGGIAAEDLVAEADVVGEDLVTEEESE
jgi:large subunit ribosomal protein L10